MPNRLAPLAAVAQRPDVARGSLLMVLAAACVAADAAVVRVVSAELHPLQIGFFRALFSLLAMAPWLWRAGLAGLRSARLPLHALRAALKLGALVAYFYALSVMPLAAVTAIGFATPLFAALGAVLVLGETMRARRGLAILVGFAGVLIVLRPGGAVLDPGALFALAAALGLAASALMVKFLAHREPPTAIVGLNLLLTVPLALLVSLPVWVTPDLRLLGWLVLQGLLGACSRIAFTRAMALADASVLMPIEFVRLPLVVLIAYLAFGELADLWTWLGGAVIFGSTVFLARRETRRTIEVASE
jgi:drug/metabolite transporter (DMT)-like permease